MPQNPLLIVKAPALNPQSTPDNAPYRTPQGLQGSPLGRSWDLVSKVLSTRTGDIWVVVKIMVLGTLNNRCRIILGTRKGTIILTTTHIDVSR